MARELNELREAWLNPPEWTRTEVLEFPGSMDGPWRPYIDPQTVTGDIGAVKYPRLVPRDQEGARLLKECTLTGHYNERPARLDRAHRTLNAAEFAADGWEPVPLACSPFVDPDVMRVSEALLGKERLDDDEA